MASSEVVSQHSHRGPEENYIKNPNKQSPGCEPEYKAAVLHALQQFVLKLKLSL
jgi:hypothetical protein